MGAKSSSERGTDLHTSSFPLADAHRNAGALAIGPQTQLLLANGSSVLQLDFATKKTSLYAGKDLAGGCIDGHRLDQARFERVSSLIFVDSTIYLVDCDNCRIRSIKDDMVSCFAGNGSQFVQDGPRLNASFFYPWSIIHFLGRLFVSDIGGNNIRIISENGIVTTLGNQPGEAKWRWKTPLMSDEKKWRQERSKDKQAPTHLGSSGDIYQGLPPAALFEEGEGGALRISRPRSLAFRPQPDSPSAASRSHLLVTETLANGSSRILSLDLEAKEADVVCGWTENWTKVSGKPNKLKDSGVHSGSSTLPSSPTSYSSLHEDSPSHGDAQRSETKTKSGSSLNSSSSSNTTSSSSSSSSTKAPLIGMIATTPHNPDEVIVSDEESHVLWRVSLIDGSSEILAGKHKSSGSKDGPLKSAKCDSPKSPCFAPSGDLMWIEASTKIQSPRIRYIREYGAITSALRLVDEAKKKGSTPVTVNASTTTGNANSRSGDNIGGGNGSFNAVVGPGGVTGSGEARIDPLRSSTASGLGASAVNGPVHYQSSSTATTGKDAASSSGQDSPSLNHSSLPSTPSKPSTTSQSSSVCGVLDTLRGVISSASHVSGSSSQPESPHTPPASPGGSQPILTPPPGGFQGFQPTRTTPRSTESTGEVRGEVSPIVLVTAWPSTSSASPNEPSNKGKEETPIFPHQSSPHLLVASGVPTTQEISAQSPGEFSPSSSTFSSSSSSALAQSSFALNASNASTVSSQTSALSTSSGLSNLSSTTASTSTVQSSTHQNPVAHRPVHPVGGLSQSQGVYGGPTPGQWTTTKTPSSTSLSTQGSSPSASSTSPLPSTIHVNIGGSAGASGSPRYSHLQTSAPIPYSSSSSLSNSSSSTGIVAPASVTSPSPQWGAAVPQASRTPPASPSSQSSSNSSLPSSPSATSTSSIPFMARQRSRPGDMGSGTGANPNSSASSPSTANSQSHVSSTATTTATTASSPTTGSISGSPSSPRTALTGSPSSPAGLFSFSITHTSIGPSGGPAANQHNLKSVTSGHLSPHLHPGSSPYSSSSSTSSTSSISSISSLQPSAEAITDGWTFIHDE